MAFFCFLVIEAPDPITDGARGLVGKKGDMRILPVVAVIIIIINKLRNLLC